MSGGTYLFSTNADSINSSIEFKPTDDQQGKLLLYNLLKNNTNRKRYFLMDINSKDFERTNETISTNDHKLSRIKPKLPDKNIKFISTIEFNEDYYNSHWMKSILSDVTNMAVMVSDDKLLQKETIYEDEIPNELLPFKNIHINYKPGNLKGLINNNLNKQYKFNVYQLLYSSNKITINNLKPASNTLIELYKYLLNNDRYLNCWMFINHHSDDTFDIYIHKLQELNFSSYCNISKILHCYNSGLTTLKEYTPNECVRIGLNMQQEKSEYSLKFVKLNDISDDSLKICIKNKNFTCPDPDGVIIELK